MSATEPSATGLTLEELQLATRNRGMPLEAMRYDITPSGLHYLLVHFDIPKIDAVTWRLSIEGAVTRSLSLTLEDIRELPRVTQAVTFECAGNGRARLNPRPLSQPWLSEAVSTAEWTGTPLAGVLSAAGLLDSAVEIVFWGADRGVQGDVEQDYARSLSLADATRPEVLLAYEMNGRPLEPQHGSPLRLVVPGWYGMTSVKWLTRIESVTAPFEGFQQRDAYRFLRDENDTGEPVQRIKPRALMIPPGIPDFFTRMRFVDAGRVLLQGRAWGSADVERVEVGIDDGFADATLRAPVGPFAWRAWSYEWDARSGSHVLSCRATDARGSIQPTEQPWNVQGVMNNLVQTVDVTVR